MVSAAALAIVGREDELATFDEFLDADDQPSRALVLDGDPGIGKTTLWRYAVARAEAGPSRVLSCVPARSEAPLAYASLRDLLDGVGDELVSRLPSPQRRALEIALLRADPGTCEARPGSDLSGGHSAFYGCWRELSPVLLAIDDAQWLDPESAAVLGFVVRRIDSSPISLLVASRGRSGRSRRARSRPGSPGRAAAAHPHRAAKPRSTSSPAERSARQSLSETDAPPAPRSLRRQPLLRARARPSARPAGRADRRRRGPPGARAAQRPGGRTPIGTCPTRPSKSSRSRRRCPTRRFESSPPSLVPIRAPWTRPSRHR